MMKKGISVAVFDAQFGPIVYSGANVDAWDTMFAKVASAGYDGIDMFTDEKTEEDYRLIKSLLDKHGLEVSMVVCITLANQGVNFSSAVEAIRRRSVDIYCREIQKAAVFAPCSMPIGFIRGPLAGCESMDENLDRLAVSVRELTDFAVTQNIRLCIEPINRYEVSTLHSVTDVVRFIHNNNLEHTYVLADLFHMNIEDTDMPKALRIAGPLLGHMHVPDSNRAAPGLGHIDYLPILRALQEIDYDGYLSSEAIPFGDSDGCAIQGARYLEQLLESVSSADKTKE